MRGTTSELAWEPRRRAFRGTRDARYGLRGDLPPDKGFREGDAGTLLKSTLFVLLNQDSQGCTCMHTGIRKLMFATAVILIVDSGAAAISHARDFGKTAPILRLKPAISGSSQHPQPAANVSKDDIREAQLELRHSGLYNGSIDGVIGPQTQQALLRFQRDNGLEQTATLDGLTLVAMFGNIGASQGSGMSSTGGRGAGQ
jgi:Putative peptidoglycan binding domain